MVALDDQINARARGLLFTVGNPNQLRTALGSGRRAFVRAPALSGDGWHAYTALKWLDRHPNQGGPAVIAWDPDTAEGGYRIVPLGAIDDRMIWIAPQ